jgi:hypothetical protein
MKTTPITIHANSQTGWANAERLTDAIRAMIRHSKGGADKRLTLKMPLGEFLDLIDEQEVRIHLLDAEAVNEVGTLGDNYNTAKLYNLENL